MAVSGGYLAFIFSMCILFGTINTLSLKLQNVSESLGYDGTVHLFRHPFLQVVAMFLGEFLCFSVYKIYMCTSEGRDSQEPVKAGFSVWYFAGPAVLDFAHTALGNIGLILTLASVYQMLRGSVVVFTSLFAYLFLDKKFSWNQIAGLVTVVVGLTIVGISSYLQPSSVLQAPNPMLGNGLILLAQILASVQFIIEDHLLTKYNVAPLLAVGYEGIFGFFLTAILLIPFYWIPGWSTGNKLENALDGFVQIGHSSIIGGALIVVIVAIAFFNYFGLTITKVSSSTTRVLVDSVRTLLIWAVCLLIGWEKFQYLQPVGFSILLIGFLIFNGVIVFPCWPDNKRPSFDHEDSVPLKSEENAD